MFLRILCKIIINYAGLTTDGTNIFQSDFNALLSANHIANGTDLVGGADVHYVDGNAGLKKMIDNPYHFLRAGVVSSTTLGSFSSTGYYWSSTAVDGSDAYYLYFYSGALYPAFQNGRGFGWSLRCVARSCQKTNN